MKWNANEYFKNVAESHILLGHTEEKPAYFREYSSSKIMIDNSDFLLKMRNAKDTVLVSIFNGDKNYPENIDQNFRINDGSVLLLKRVKSIIEIDNAKSDLEDIWEDIFAKIKNDIRTGTLQIFSFSARANSIGMIGDNYYGFAIFIAYGDAYCRAYDETRWT